MSTLNHNSVSTAGQQGSPLLLDFLLSSDGPLTEHDAQECSELQHALGASGADESTGSFGLASSRAAIEAYPDSIFTRLVEYGLLKKVTDIVLAKVKIPWNLRDDATQSMHLKWCLIQAKPQFERNQLAFYAYRSGQHAALALRRELGAVCVLPGALFREGKESVFMETIGAAVNPMDVDEYKDSMELAVEQDDMMRLATVDESLLERRLGCLGLSPKQMKVARMVLIERKDASEIADSLAMREVYVERLIKQVTLKLNNRDAGIVEPEEPKLKKASAKQVAVKKAVEKTAEKVKAPLGSKTTLRRRSLSRLDRGMVL